MQKVVGDTVKIFADIPLRTTPDEPNDQPEAIAVFVVDYDGQNLAKLVTGPLSPQPGNPIHYDSFCASDLRTLHTALWRDKIALGGDGNQLLVSTGLVSLRGRSFPHVCVDMDSCEEVSCAVREPGHCYLEIMGVELNTDAVAAPFRRRRAGCAST